MVRAGRRRTNRSSHDRLRARIIGVRDTQTGELRLYVTNTPPEILEARNVDAIYAARWEIELLFRELKTRYRIEQIPSSKRNVTEALIYAALLTLLVSRRLRLWFLQSRPDLAERMPIDRWAVLIETFAPDILHILTGPSLIRGVLEKRLKLLLFHEAQDPNRWRIHLTERAQMGTMISNRLVA